MKSRKGQGVATIRQALAGVGVVVAVELGLGRLEGMELVISAQFAEYLANANGGILSDTNDQW